ncbi:MAG TPA: hypothetical protein VHD56_14220 [Tepidisphaeraceae bacterium]|nr:hypothetical protein [Tepidisphaeraceae bacterium]
MSIPAVWEIWTHVAKLSFRVESAKLKSAPGRSSKMSDPYSSFCDDFYINMRLCSQMPMPQQRETVLHFFEQVQKAFPGMSRFRKSDNGELHLEEDRNQESYRWASLETRRLSGGCINPPDIAHAMKLHTLLLEMAPFQLGLSPVEIDYLDILFGFDLEFTGNHDEIIAESLLADSPLSCMTEERGARPVDFQPAVTVSLSDDCRLQARLDVVTRTNSYQVRTGDYSNDVISVYLIIRRYWGDRPKSPMHEIALELAERGDSLCTKYIVPKVIKPISAAISSRS